MTMLLVAGMGLDANATMIDIPLTQDNWNLVTIPDVWGTMTNSPTWEQTAEGIKFYGSGYRDGGAIASKLTADFSDAVIYLKWMAHPGNYAYFNPSVGLSSNLFYGGIGGAYSTGWSFACSAVLPTDTWLYTRIDTHPDMTWSIITSTTNYDLFGGSLVASQTFSWQAYPSLWDSIKQGHLSAWVCDDYGGTSSWLLVAEAKYDIAAVPEPASPWLMLAGMADWTGCQWGVKKSLDLTGFSAGSCGGAEFYRTASFVPLSLIFLLIPPPTRPPVKIADIDPDD